jgi:fructose-1,6-bisphosphatase-3
MNLGYLELLAEQYPSIQTAAMEIVALEANLNLPKETEHFLSDLHGEYEAFLHLLKSSSGSLRRRIDELFHDELSNRERRSLAALIYYPEQKLPLILQEVQDEQAWYRHTLPYLIGLGRSVASKYTRAHIRQSLPDGYAEIIEDLLAPQGATGDREQYYGSLIDSIISVDQGHELTVALAKLIQRLAITHLHIIGDIYDRGPGWAPLLEV